MPEISRFLGIIITMYYSEHPPPHFHVRYGEYKAVVSIEPPSLNRDELLSNWQRAMAQSPLEPIEPLE